MGILSIIWGIFAMLGAFVAFLPLLGSLNWLNIPFSIVGLIFAAIALSNERTRGQGIAGLVLGLLAVTIGIVRLHMGWFVL
jgi:uncharacterized membrane protein